ncbi:histone-lysine N-methyltransferase ATX2-like isoform X1 [Apium graveolens]|uniref:histone-lysine N-methyltransferase ATX2-like isoform X1 n=1 Tax=Apium graveolens TaxID=4045 RepID=UPI003D79BB9F
MEVLRDGNMLNKPMFRVTSEKGDRFEGPTSSSCWDKLYGKLRKLHSPDALNAFEEQNKIVRSGPNFFGFSHPEIRELIQILRALYIYTRSTLYQQLSLTKERPSHSSKFAFKRCEDLAVGYRSIHITWKDLDKCNVCHTDEEYDINPFLQCENCRMLRSAETFFLDERKMEPIDGLNRMNKYRLKVLCSICKVSHGACIQCSHSSCRVAYHPLCARTAGFYHEFENEDRLCHNSGKEDEDNLRIRLISYCKRHRRPSDKGIVVQDKIGQSACQQSDYIPSPNPSGCARTGLFFKPYDYLSRRGRKEPQSHEIVPLKRLYWRTGHT